MRCFNEVQYGPTIKLSNVRCWGVTKNNYGVGFVVPIRVDDQRAVIDLLDELAIKYKTECPYYGCNFKTLYLKTGGLTTEQRRDLVGKNRRTRVSITFNLAGINTTQEE